MNGVRPILHRSVRVVSVAYQYFEFIGQLDDDVFADFEIVHPITLNGEFV